MYATTLQLTYVSCSIHNIVKIAQKMHKNILNAIDPILNLHSLHNQSCFSALNINLDVLRSYRHQIVLVMIN